MEQRHLTLDIDGAEHFQAALTSDLIAELKSLAASLAVDRAGVRIARSATLAQWLDRSNLTVLASDRIGARAKPVRAILFDKSPHNNWSLGWHQDRTIAVTGRTDTPGFGPWSVKAGIVHVEPPFAIIERMRTMRIHLDPVPPTNSPLLIAPGSHLLGRIIESKIRPAIAQCGEFACLADVGDVWLYRTPILHASAPSVYDGQRRVLQVDFSSSELPGPLRWQGVQ